MNTLKRILLVFVLCSLAVAYLYQHSYSVRLTRTLSRLETRRQLLFEKLDSIESEIVELSSFSRLESLWVAQGRPPAPPGQSGPLEVAEAEVKGQGANAQDEATR
jgi:hypothetical protein